MAPALASPDTLRIWAEAASEAAALVEDSTAAREDSTAVAEDFTVVVEDSMAVAAGSTVVAVDSTVAGEDSMAAGEDMVVVEDMVAGAVGIVKVARVITSFDPDPSSEAARWGGHLASAGMR